MTGTVVLLLALTVAGAVGLSLRRSGRRLAALPRRRAVADSRITSEELGTALGERATLVQFSTAFCQPCRTTRRVLAAVSAQVEGVRHVEIDAESYLDLVRRFGVLRTPTVFVLDHDGRVVRRASGQPRTADVVAALGDAISA